MPIFRKKPIEIEAIRFDGSNAEQISTFIGNMVNLLNDDSPDIADRMLIIDTLEGGMIAKPNDWIIKGVKGEFYPCKPDVFEQTYEFVRVA